ncbi:MAG: mandelate racemase/muconate lactonizing enzyme family protein [Acidimicrobiia bacterium]
MTTEPALSNRAEPGNFGTPVIVAVETILLEEYPNLVHVRVYTDDGVVGLGETYFGARAVASWIHETAAPYLVGKNPLEIERHWQGLNPFLGFNSTGVEGRGRSAIDIALWDILGKYSGLPIYQLLGGAYRDKVRVYNTCAGYRYVRARPRKAGLEESNWGTDSDEGPYEDLTAFLNDAGELAHSLLEQGISAMKIWPLDLLVGSGGDYIRNEDIRKGCEPFRKIRDAVGDKMEIMVEMHSLWDLPTAKRIADAVREFEPAWLEDPIKMDSIDALRRFSESARMPVAASETLASRWSFQDLMSRGGVDIVIFDPAWCGGITEGKKIAAMAESHQLPVAPHDCSGPVEFAASVHLTTNLPNAIFQESVRAFYSGWYRDLVTNVPAVVDGFVHPLSGPGLGTELQPGLTERPDAFVQTSRLRAGEVGVEEEVYGGRT